MTPKLYIFCGIPFSGKTTLAKQIVAKLGFTRIDLDEVKFSLFGNSIMDAEIDQKGWDQIYQEMYHQIREALKRGETLIHDTGNFTKSERGVVHDIATNLGIESVTIFVDLPQDIAYQRLLANRQTKVRFDVSDQDFLSTVGEMEKPGGEEKHLVFNAFGDINIDLWIQTNLS